MPPQPPVSLLRQAADRRLRRAEVGIERAVLQAVTDWLAAVRFIIIRELLDQRGLTAAGDPPPERSIDAASRVWADWRRSVENNVLPAVSAQFGDAFQQTRLANRDRGSFTPQMEYMETVADRLRIWPEGAFEQIRPELIEALADADTIEQITDRVGMVLGIDTDQRVIKAEINAIEARLKDDGLSTETAKALRARRRDLWEQHDAEETRWRWMARRIARTEAHGAVQAGQLAAARQNEADTGDTWFKRWLATDDPRTRVTHRVADGQAVPLSEKFRVGGFLLEHPGDPITIAPHETINCLTDPDTSIATDRGPKRVSDIQVGDRVLTHRMRFRPVVRLAPPRQHSGDVVCLDVGDAVLRLTENHPVLTDQGWVIAGELSRGRIVLCASPVEFGHRLEQRRLFGEDRSCARAASATDAHRPVCDQFGMALLDDEVGEQRRAQLSRLRVGDLPAEHLGPAVLERLPVRVDDSDTRDLVQKSDDALVAVHRQDLRLVVEGPSGVLPPTARTADGDRALTVDERGDVGGSDGIEFHPTMLPRTVVRYWVERADQVQLFNFAVDEDESYVANGIVVHNCRCTMLIYPPDALQDALQGPDGSTGKVEPEGVRIGPDDPDEAARVIVEVAEREARELPDVDVRGEDHGQAAPAAPVVVELTDDREVPVLDVDPDFSTYDDEQLLELMTQNLGTDDGLYERARNEFDRRSQLPPADTPVVVAEAPGFDPDSTGIMDRAELESFGVVAPDTDTQRWRYLDPHEKSTAEWLADKGVTVQSVDRMKKRKTPDAVIADPAGVPTEFKALHPGAPFGSQPFSHLGLVRRVEEIAEKSRRGVIDLRSTRGSYSAILAALADGVTRHGARLVELVVVYRGFDGRDYTLGWRRGKRP